MYHQHHCRGLTGLFLLLAGLCWGTHAQAQGTIRGVIRRVTPSGIQLTTGATYRRGKNAGALLANPYSGGVNDLTWEGRFGWSQLAAGDWVRINFDRQHRIGFVGVLGKVVQGRAEQLLINWMPAQGEWKPQVNQHIAGHVYRWCISMGPTANNPATAVVENDEGYDLLEAWVGRIDVPNRQYGKLLFTVLGDGETLYVSPQMGWDTPAEHISVPIRGHRKITLAVTASKLLDLADAAVWGDCKLVKILRPAPAKRSGSASGLPAGLTSVPSPAYGAVAADASPTTRPRAVAVRLTACPARPAPAPSHASGGRVIPITHELRAQIDDIMVHLQHGDVPSFQDGRISNADLVEFGYINAYDGLGLMRKGDTGRVPASEVDRLTMKYFGRHINTHGPFKSDARYHYANGYFVGSFGDPDEAFGGKLVRLVRLSGGMYRAYVDVPGPDPSYKPDRDELTLRRMTILGHPRFVVVGYLDRASHP